MTGDIFQHWAQKVDVWIEVKGGEKEILLFIKNWRAHKTVNCRQNKIAFSLPFQLLLLKSQQTKHDP